MSLLSNWFFFVDNGSVSVMKSMCLAWPICKQLLLRILIVWACCGLRLKSDRWLDKLEREAGGGGGGLIVHWNHENSQLCSYLVSSITNCSCWCSCGILMKGLRLPEYKHSVSYILHVVDYIMARLTLTLASVRKCKLLLSFHWNKTSLAKRLQNLMKNTCTLWDFVSSVSIGNERGK